MPGKDDKKVVGELIQRLIYYQRENDFDDWLGCYVGSETNGLKKGYDFTSG